MTRTELISKLESKARPLLLGLPHHYAVSFYSNQKKKFLLRFAEDYLRMSKISHPKGIRDDRGKGIQESSIHNRRLWGIDFGFPLFNAAGMFKKGEGYYTVAMQGAGAWLAGTTTGLVRHGNFKSGVLHPFAPLPSSKSSVNWMGLPNEGHGVVARRISHLQKMPNCPIGVSLSADTGIKEIESLGLLVGGLKMYESSGADFAEINESCPNTGEERSSLGSIDPELTNRLEYVRDNFLQKRQKNFPVIVKLSVDTDSKLVPSLINLLIEMGFDGVNFGNTSTDYSGILTEINQKERGLFEYFTSEFGGGVSGKPLNKPSLNLVKIASEHLKNKNLKKEFHIIRTGGIESSEDLSESLSSGASLCSWYTGYFSQFSIHGHELYTNMNYSK
jgi:dihydroorotate dehydrogenase